MEVTGQMTLMGYNKLTFGDAARDAFRSSIADLCGVTIATKDADTSGSGSGKATAATITVDLAENEEKPGGLRRPMRRRLLQGVGAAGSKVVVNFAIAPLSPAAGLKASAAIDALQADASPFVKDMKLSVGGAQIVDATLSGPAATNPVACPLTTIPCAMCEAMKPSGPATKRKAGGGKPRRGCTPAAPIVHKEVKPIMGMLGAIENRIKDKIKDVDAQFKKKDEDAAAEAEAWEKQQDGAVDDAAVALDALKEKVVNNTKKVSMLRNKLQTSEKELEASLEKVAAMEEPPEEEHLAAHKDADKKMKDDVKKDKAAAEKTLKEELEHIAETKSSVESLNAKAARRRRR